MTQGCYMDTYIYIHTATIGRYKERLEQYINQIIDSGLYDYVKHIYINYVGDNEFHFDYQSLDINHKISSTNVSPHLDDFELPTQAKLYQFCKEHPDSKILYLHTKGIHGEINPCIEDWVTYMTYFAITKWKDCITYLDTYWTVGVDLRMDPTLHYSGNFWWSRSNHIADLPEPIDFSNLERYPNPLHSPRHNQEFWICYDKNINKHACLWESNINCYERHLHLYPLSHYVKN